MLDTEKARTVKIGVLLRILLLLLLMITLGACSTAQTKDAKPSDKTVEELAFHPDFATQIQKQITSVEGVEDGVVLVLKNEISAAIKVSGFQRLHLKSIKEKVHKTIKQMAEDYTVHVTADKKLFRSLQEMDQQLKDIPQGQKATGIQERFDKINKDMQG